MKKEPVPKSTLPKIHRGGTGRARALPGLALATTNSSIATTWPGRVFVDHTPVGRLQAKTCLINIHALPSASLRCWERRRQSLAWPMAYWQTRCGAICHCCLTVKHILIECPPLTNVQLLITGIRSIACQAENSIPVFHVSNGVLLYTTVKQWTEGSHIDSDNAVRKYARNL